MTPEFRLTTGEWIDAWRRYLMKSLGWSEPLQYFIARDSAEKICAAVPFSIRRKMGLSALSLAGPYVPFRGFPVANDQRMRVVELVADHLTSKHSGRILRMAPIPEWDPVTGLLIEALEQRGWQIQRSQNGLRQVITLPVSFEDFAAERKGSRWSTYGRRERKMGREQQVSLQLFATEDHPDWTAVIRDVAKVEQESWLTWDGGDLRFVGEANQAFWNSVLTSTDRDLAARVWVLYWDDTPVAFNLNLDVESCRYHIAGHYAEQAGAYSPGAILMRYLVQDAIERRLSLIDMGTGDPGYKAYWGSVPRERLIECTAFPPSLQGRILRHAFAGLSFASGAAGRAQRVVSRLISLFIG
jgi:CelD/BcsL family acetyltransferase involved in cellulose biosynthesis